MNNATDQKPAEFPDCQPGEKLIWAGRPGRQCVSKSRAVVYVATGVLIGVLLAATLTLEGNDLPAWVPAEIFDMLSLPFSRIILTLLALAFLCYPALMHKALSTVRYVVTDKRLVSYADWRDTRSLSSYAYSEMRKVLVIPQGGGLSTVRIYLTPPAVPEYDTKAAGIDFLFVPDAAAEYIRSACESNNEQ